MSHNIPTNIMSPITELVEMCLTQPFDKFIHFFEREQLPVLLNAPGIISVRTGTPENVQTDGDLADSSKDRSFTFRPTHRTALRLCLLLYGIA